MSNSIHITLSNDEALVLFEFFERCEEQAQFRVRSNAEYLALMGIASQLDKALVTPFQADYLEQLEAAQNRLSFAYEGSAPGVEQAREDQTPQE